MESPPSAGLQKLQTCGQTFESKDTFKIQLAWIVQWTPIKVKFYSYLKDNHAKPGSPGETTHDPISHVQTDSKKIHKHISPKGIKR